jgi:hypothetical protein
VTDGGVVTAEPLGSAVSLQGSFQRLAGYNSMASTKLALYRDFRQAGEIGGFKEDCMVMKWDGGG